MKKSLITLTIMLAAAAMIAAFSCPAQAAVTGSCVECHTMHNSQGGGNMAQDESGTTTSTAYAHLTISSCVGCHFTQTTVDAPKINAEYNDASTAGGTFKDTGSTGSVQDDHGVHNVSIALSTIGDESSLTVIPGLGTGNNMNHQSGGSSTVTDLTCAGMKGCHGQASVDGNDAGIKGFHHGGEPGWRYLQIDNGTAVVGVGADDWELAMSDGWASGDEHNVYSSSTTVGINKLCANCHSDFHGIGNTQDVDNNWIRHPTDNAIPTDWSAVVDYRDNPFAFADTSSMSASGTYTNDGAQVACVSCHRAHGTPYDDILRWDYNDQSAGSTTVGYGCLGCHTKQQG